VLYALASVSLWAYWSRRAHGLALAARVLVWLGFLCNTLAIGLRVHLTQRAPFANQYEFALVFGWGIVLVLMIVSGRLRRLELAVFSMPPAALVMLYAWMLPADVRPLMPALMSTWLVIHVGLAVVSYGSFAVAAGIGALVLVGGKRLNLAALDQMKQRIVIVGFFGLTLVIITGAVWAHQAWSRYWGWDPKETWSLITWIVYAVYLHMSLNRGWTGRRSAYLAIIGFALVLFTYAGVNLLMSGLHTYR